MCDGQALDCLRRNGVGEEIVAAVVEGVSAPLCVMAFDGKTSTSTFDHERLGLLVGVDVAARIVAALTDPVPDS